MKKISCSIFKIFLMLSSSSSAMADTSYETFDIHFTVLTSNPSAHLVATLSQFQEEVNILNTYFVKEDRSPIIKFRFKSASFYNDIKNSTCSFIELGDTMNQNDTDWATHFNSCNDPLVKNKNALNFYIFDSYNENYGYNHKDGFGKRNSNRPFIVLDWQRLNHNIQAPEEHEMGHAFGLSHFCALGASPTSSTNIMSSSCQGGSTGKRDIGFNNEQVNIIMYYVPLIKAKLALP
ncbi:hypothetical protein EXE30_02135 [Acinetobacter halotolerans]|uniref:Metalloprotease n=1 Tax=Acinetobacter halotolerans TaxID=1752076 RepID=A0A4Q6XKJ4_9GAMM|nr:hypothetical protein [Acinetobacter halotolerans]RZF55628.1 hypothetical protein EXE30_02135 [Acinetobacter halotolerans]